MKRVLLIVFLTLSLEGEPTRRALLIGINDYTASRIPQRPRPSAPGREWWNLSGAAADAGLLREMLVGLHGFDPANVLLLIDQEATRAKILEAIDRHLTRPAARGDEILFYYAGHGSQVANSLSDESDKLDETIVPADSRLGAPDIRDKELRFFFNRILSSGARLTVILDNCFSGSGARGLATGARPRSVQRDPRDLADGTNYGPRPEDLGALVLSGAQDTDAAWEIRDEQGTIHGAFSWALIRALRDSAPAETASETFARARARMRAETPFQEPVIAGNDAVRHRPFLGRRMDRRGDRTVVAVEKVQRDGTVVLHGGWANGLSVGCELIDRQTAARLTVTAIRDPGRSEARPQRGIGTRPGALLEVVAWTASNPRPLRVWMPRPTNDATAFARRIADAVAKRNVRWIDDPTEITPTHLLRPGSSGWELVDTSGKLEQLGGNDSAIAAVSRVAAGSSLFVQLPAPTMRIDGVVRAPRAADADYVLTGRYSRAKRRIEYAWIRPGVKRSDGARSGLPVRTVWQTSHESLRDAALRLRRIHAWFHLQTPPASRSPYELAIRRRSDGALIEEPRVVMGGETYELVLRATPARVAPRYVYVFVIDNHGKSFLVFPRWGSVENRFSQGQSEIRLGDAGSFKVTEPFGIDTYFLLTTDVPLSDPWILDWDGVRSVSGRFAIGSNWSLDKYVYESVRPRASSKR